MPSRQEWINALITKRKVNVDSTSNLIDSVKNISVSKSFKGKRKKITQVSQFANPAIIKISPLELLFSLGKISTPRIHNLVDLSTTWAIIRYIWVFNPDLKVQNLALSHYARNLDFHQKAVMSDDLGVAFSNFLVRRYFGGLYPQPVSIALRNNNPMRIKQRYNASPDYIYKDRKGGYIIVECKGTTSGLQNSIKQLARGVEQVPSIKIGRKIPLGLVIGACMNDKNTLINIIDPPEEEDREEQPKPIIIEDPERFDRELEVYNNANCLRFAGQNKLANDILRTMEISDDIFITNNMETTNIIVSELEDKFTGIISPFFYLGDGLRTRVFKGISDSILNGFTENYNLGERQIIRFNENVSSKYISLNDKSEYEGDYIFKSSIKNINTANIISDDGTIMSVEIEEV